MYAYQNEPCFSMHTFEIRSRINREDYHLAYERMRQYCKRYKKPIYMINKKGNEVPCDISSTENADTNYDIYDSPYDYIDSIPVVATKEEIVCEALKDRGIIIKFVRCKLGEQPIYYGVWMIINPRRFLGDNTYVGIFDINRADELLNNLHNAFFGMGIGHLSLNNFRLHRIDLCRNVFLHNSDMVSSNIELLKKCYVPNHYSWNEIGNTEYGIRLKDGIKVANKSIAIVAYNKQKQMINQGGYYSIDDIAEANGLLRFEIQLFIGRIRYLYKKDDTLNNLYDFFYHCEALSIQHFEKYLPKIFLRGDYYTLDIAKKIVMESGYYEQTKKHMLTLLQNVSIYRNLMTALDKTCIKFKPENPDNFIRSLIKHFDDLHLHPVTIPRRWEGTGGFFLPGAYNNVMGIKTLFVSVVN